MRIATSWSTAPTTGAAVQEACRELDGKLGGKPDLTFAFATVAHDIPKLAALLSDYIPGASCGGTSSTGVITEDGFHSENGFGFGMMGISDPNGAYGIGAAKVNGDPRASAALEAAKSANRPGEVPRVVVLTAPPGSEEAMLQGVADIFGPDVPVIGGSSADNTLEGHWTQFANGTVHPGSVIATALFPSSEVTYGFHSGYAPTGVTGRITRVQGRTIHEIDGRPAAHVYNEWSGGIVESALPQGGTIHLCTALHALGRVVGKVNGIPYYRISHPARVTPDGGLVVFTEMQEDDEITLMTSTKDHLVTRAAHVTSAALDVGSLTIDDVSGALVFYCAGMLFTVQENIGRAVVELRSALGNKPFLAPCTFGEQGCFPGGENCHGNLMVSLLAFAN